MRKLSKDIKILIGLLFFLIAIVVLFGRGREVSSETELIPRRTSYSSTPGGVRALYNTLDRLGYPVQRQLCELTTAPSDGVLFMLAPETSPSPSEWLAVREWVKRGNVLVVAGSELTMPTTLFGKQHAVETHPTGPSFLSSDTRSFAIAEKARVKSTEMSLDKLRGLVKPFG